jgi:VanZ family protein
MSAIAEKMRVARASKTSRRFWRYAPLALWLGFIFFASTDAFSAAHTSRIIRPLLLWLNPNASEETIEFIHFLVRKGAHFTEYAILALLAARAFLSSSRLWLRRGWFVAAFALVAFYALFDEYHQSFVPSRTASIKDSFIDMTGGVIALVVVALSRSFSRAQKNRETIL